MASIFNVTPPLRNELKKPGPTLQPQGIYKDNEPETLGVIQHLRINGQSEVPGQNAGKKTKVTPSEMPQT